MRAKLKAVKTELILLSAAAVFLCALLGLAHHDRLSGPVFTETGLPPEEIEVTMVDINRAAEEELTTLPGIGASLAQRIVDDRAANGPFDTVEDLMRVSGIGEKKFEELRDYITAGKEQSVENSGS